MIHRPRFRACLSICLTFFLVCMSMWSYGAEATMDDIAGGEIVQVFSDDSGLLDHGPIDKTCNHGCHAQSHLAGLQRGHEALISPVPLSQVLPPELATLNILVQPGEGPFRPPRPSFQA